MLFLSPDEKRLWKELLPQIQETSLGPDRFGQDMKPAVRAAFRCFAGVRLALSGAPEKSREWLNAGVWEEGDSQFFNAYLSGFLKRYNGRMAVPEKVFSDPRPYVHLTQVPVLKDSRERFLKAIPASLPRFGKPFSFLDLGCGDGGLTARFLQTLRLAGNISEIREVCLVDSSPAMLELAVKTLAPLVPEDKIKPVQATFGHFAENPGGPYDVALSSLAFHHMPVESKAACLAKLKDHLDHFILFEMDANNDRPEMGSPELLFSVYQSYGGLTEHVFSHDAPVDVVLACVDRLLMNEAISLFTQPRGERNDYHMLSSEWRDLFGEVLGPGFSRLQDFSCHEDANFGFMAMHYGR